MCIVADSVNDVSKTKIVSFHVAYKLNNQLTPAQLIVYSATVDSLANSNAFILPVYNPGNDQQNIIPLDFSKLPRFIDDIDSLYNKWFPRDTMRLTNSLNYTLQGDGYLDVHRVGDYKFSIVPSKIDFNRIDKSQLNIDPAAKVSVDAHTNDYSFIVYQFFQRGNLDVTPFGYLCKPYQENAMVIPTIHGHPHSAPLIGYFREDNLTHNSSEFENYADYDHKIYALLKNPDSNMDSKYKSSIVTLRDLLGKINTDYMGRFIVIYPPLSFVPKKIDIKGKKFNRNMLIDLDGTSFINDLVCA